MGTIQNILDTKGYAVHCVASDATIESAIIEMCRLKIGALVVLEPDRPPVGILSERDLLVRVLLRRRDPSTTSVGSIMTREIVCINADCTVSRAMTLMTNVRCRHLPVVAGRDLVGLVSIGDLVREVGRDQAAELRTMHEYVEGKYPG
jgi:signal-transduction protein with cAMP-binding, CBS, and nucleotidyltransferase domain